MSRIYLEMKKWPERYEVIVGWDPGLQTYFAQVIDPEYDEEEPIVWLGTFDVIPTVSDLEKLLNFNMPAGTPYCEFPVEVVGQLESDRKENI